MLSSLIVLAGCGSGHGRGSDAEQPLPFSTISQGVFSRIEEQRLVVEHDQTMLEALWSEHVAGILPPPPVPTVDFRRDMLIGVFLGARPSGGFDVTIGSIVRTSAGVIVRFEEMAPGKGCFVTLAVTAPFHMVALPRSQAEVAFEGSKRVVDCP